MLKTIKGFGMKKRKYENHGMSKHPMYNSWKKMIKRCHCKTDKDYSRYGARGISVCETWRLSFFAFYIDMGERPEGMTLERIDNNGDYCKTNCKWATITEQSRNQRPQKNSKTGIRGVYFCEKRNKYKAFLYYNGSKKHLGVFDGIEEAKEARLEAERKVYHLSISS